MKRATSVRSVYHMALKKRDFIAWSYEFYDMTLATEKQRRHMIKLIHDLEKAGPFDHYSFNTKTENFAVVLFHLNSM